jgi:hypothetical protein
MGAVVQRGPHGHFLPGQSGNARGRPASLARVRELLRPHAERFIAELVQLLDSDEEAIRLAAIKEFMDRYIGKPVATVESDVRHMDVNQAIQQMWLQAVSGKVGGYGTPTIDVEATTSSTTAPPAVPPSDDADDNDAVAHKGEW